MPKGRPIFGESFRQVREQLFLTQLDLAQALEMSESGVRRIESLVVASVSDKTIRRLAELAKATPAGLLSRIGAPAEVLVAIAAEEGKTPEEMAPIDGRTAGDGGLDLSTVKAVRHVPLFELPLAAGGWSEVPESVVVCDPAVQGYGHFRVRLSGDSMTPEYPDGQVVEFACNPETIVGRDYYVQLNDNTATFKRLHKVKGSVVLLAALNRGRFPELIRVSRERIVKMAIAVAKVQLL